MSEVIVVVVLQAKPGKGEALRGLMTASAQHTHSESGCLTYALHASNDDPDRLALVERWSDQSALDAHLQQPYVQKLFADLDEVLAVSPTTAFCSPIPAGNPVKGRLATA